MTQVYDQHLASIGLRATQYALLRTLAYIEPATMQSLASAIVMDRTTLTRALRPLQRDGLITAARGRDGRTRVLTVTPEGQIRLAHGRGKWNAAQIEFERRYGSDDVASLRTMLTRVVERMGE